MVADSRKSDLLQGTLDMLILKVVALRPIHGYAIAQRLQRMSSAVLQVQQGSLYPALHRLEKRRWLYLLYGPAGRD
jgi:DNA-binding PadR family transcriptional regulator